jgi:hypothetical protein
MLLYTLTFSAYSNGSNSLYCSDKDSVLYIKSRKMFQYCIKSLQISMEDCNSLLLYIYVCVCPWCTFRSQVFSSTIPLDQWFPKSASRIPRDSRHIPRVPVYTYL